MFVDGNPASGCASTNKFFCVPKTMVVCRPTAGRRHRQIMVGSADMAADRAAGVNGAVPLAVGNPVALFGLLTMAV
jgi:hypothetical protein